jgi:hypothetical protein
VAHTRYLNAGQRARVQAAAGLFRELGPGSSRAEVDYPELIDGEVDFVLFWRTLP